MSLRARLIAFFCALAVAPLAAIGVFDYLHSMRALDALIASQTQTIAERAAADLTDRYALRQSDLLLLAENAETRRMYQAHARGDAAAYAAAATAATSYLSQAWTGFARWYDWVEFRDTAGELLHALGDGRSGAASDPRRPGAVEALVVQTPVPDADRQRRLGIVIAAVRPEALLPREALESRFGRSGYSVVIDRARGRVVYHPLHAFLGRTTAELFGPHGWNSDPQALGQDRGSFAFHEGDTTRIAAFVSLTAPAWTVVATGSVNEFAPPFLHMRLINLALVLLVTGLAATGFILLTRRATRSLEALTRAADEVGAGNFAPALPKPGPDEVGRLAAAFGLMATKAGEMVREIETSRHMAAVGQFAAQLSHEIRNPLTSLKLNLQSIARDAAAGALPPATTRPIQICLREIERLDRVVRGALRLGREAGKERVACRLHSVVTEALDLVHAQLDQQRVSVETSLRAPDDLVRAEPEDLKAAFLNLFLNAAEAMPGGGTLSVHTLDLPANDHAASAIRVRVRDTGPGVPDGLRDKIFDPFYSTKSQGTGFGLPVALRTVEEHGGHLGLEAPENADGGATFVVDLPLAADGVVR
jgi:signal transduction histidine kinase